MTSPTSTTNSDARKALTNVGSTVAILIVQARQSKRDSEAMEIASAFDLSRKGKE